MKTLLAMIAILTIHVSCSGDKAGSGAVISAPQVGEGGGGSSIPDLDPKDPSLKFCLHPDATNYDESCQEGMGWCYFYLCLDKSYEEYSQELIDEYTSHIQTQQGGAIFHNPQLCQKQKDQSVTGCAEPLAVNYDEKVSLDDGSCEFAACTSTGTAGYQADEPIRSAYQMYRQRFEEAAELISDPTRCQTGGQDKIGCKLEGAENYNPSAAEDGSCLFKLCLNDEASVHEVKLKCEQYTAGCEFENDPTQCDSGSKVQGCMIQKAINYNAQANLPADCHFRACLDQGYENYSQQSLDEIKKLCQNYPGVCHPVQHHQALCGDKRVFKAKTHIFVASNGAGLKISRDGGETWEVKNRRDGIGSTIQREVAVDGDNVYVATTRGLSISRDRGQSFTNKTTANGLGSDRVNGVVVKGDKVYVATDGGVSISTDAGESFVNKTTQDGLRINTVSSIRLANGKIYAGLYQLDRVHGSNGGVAVSSDGGESFETLYVPENRKKRVYQIAALDEHIYVANANGLSVSKNAGQSFEVKDAMYGLASTPDFRVEQTGASLFGQMKVSDDKQFICVGTTQEGVSLSFNGGDIFTARKHGDGSGLPEHDWYPGPGKKTGNIYFCELYEDKIVITVSRKVYYSDNNGQTFKEYKKFLNDHSHPRFIVFKEYD